MILYVKLWQVMRERGISQYRLIKDYGISNGQLDRLRKNGNVSTFTLNQLCMILDCTLEDIVEYRFDPTVDQLPKKVPDPSDCIKK